uniref:US22 family protein n=1 Tax=Leptobrachium leishanense TaxID=445787 RepID=A0A8C5R2R3_9ANUR
MSRTEIDHYDCEDRHQNNRKSQQPGKKYGIHKKGEENRSLEDELLDMLQSNPGDLQAISDYVQKRKNKEWKFSKNPQLSLRICDLNGTVYFGQKYMLESWQSLYLPRKTRMVVLGAIDNYPCMGTGIQLIILVAEDGRVFAYEEQVLSLIANSLPELVESGITSHKEMYSYPDELSDEDEETLQKNEEIQKIRKRMKDFVNSKAEAFEEILNYF